ncbi:MAG TPA: SAM-dependent methyltransferase [Ktedonobacterales bacterium]|jgi:methyltransferase (TIGR00027 family)|nr:SAM-dependent methyltransferase [Ktedonobacterales bacterium]
MGAMAQTALWMAAARAGESRRPDRLFDDPYAAAVAAGSGISPTATQESGSALIAIRTRFFDDYLLRATEVFGACQVMILVVGLDARAYRLPWPHGTTVYELDRPELLAVKDAILAREGAVPSCERKPLGVDLAADWTSTQIDAGYRHEEASAWLAEGLLFYLEEPAVQALLGRVADLAAYCSRLAVDTVNAGYLTSKWTTNVPPRFAQHGCSWRFGTDEPERLLAERGWRAWVTQAGEQGASNGRWPAAPSRVPQAPRWFFVTAERAWPVRANNRLALH